MNICTNFDLKIYYCIACFGLEIHMYCLILPCTGESTKHQIQQAFTKLQTALLSPKPGMLKKDSNGDVVFKLKFIFSILTHENYQCAMLAVREGRCYGTFCIFHILEDKDTKKICTLTSPLPHCQPSTIVIRASNSHVPINLNLNVI